MLNNLKNRLLTGWGLMRFVRLGLSVILIAQAIILSELLFASLGIVLLFQAAFNYGCCGEGGCDTNHTARNHKSLNTQEEITTFNEVK